LDEYKFLGHIVSKQLHNNHDVKYRLNVFYGISDSVVRNFTKDFVKSIIFIFYSYCLSDHGLSLWNSYITFGKYGFKSFIAGNPLQKVVKIHISSSSHLNADICDPLLLQPNITFLQAR